MEKTFVVKEGIKETDFMFLNPKLLVIFAELCIYAHNNNLPVVITSMIEDVPGRKFKTHSEGRAIDISTKGWSLKNIKEVEYNFNDWFEDIGAISASDYKPRAVVYHKIPGGVDHFHFQVKRD